MFDPASADTVAPPQLKPLRIAARKRPSWVTWLSVVLMFIGVSYVTTNWVRMYPIPVAVRIAKIVEGVFWLGLGIGVYRRLPSRTRICIAWILIVTGLSSIAWLVPHEPVPTPAGGRTATPVERIVVAFVFIVPGLGIWRATEWARRAILPVTVGYLVYQLVITAVTWSSYSEQPRHVSLQLYVILAALSLLFPTGLVIYSRRTSTRDHFAAVRAAASRSRS
jgi:hypothetical protein